MGILGLAVGGASRILEDRAAVGKALPSPGSVTFQALARPPADYSTTPSAVIWTQPGELFVQSVVTRGTSESVDSDPPGLQVSETVASYRAASFAASVNNTLRSASSIFLSNLSSFNWNRACAPWGPPRSDRFLSDDEV